MNVGSGGDNDASGYFTPHPEISVECIKLLEFDAKLSETKKILLLLNVGTKIIMLVIFIKFIMHFNAQ